MQRCLGLLLAVSLLYLVPAHAKDIEVRGRVVDEAGSPVSSATVTGVLKQYGPILLNRKTGSLIAIDEIMRTDCDEAGEFALTLQSELLPLTLCATAPDLGYSAIVLSMSMPDGKLVLGLQNAPDSEPYSAPLEFVLPRSFLYAGRVLDEAGNPVVGAQVHYSEFHQPSITDAEGRFTIEKIPERAREDGTMSITHPDFANMRSQSFPEEPIVIARGAEVTGRVVSTSGLGMPGVPIHIEQAIVTRRGTAWIGGTVTDEHGRYSTRVVSGMRLTVAVSVYRSPYYESHYARPEWHVIDPESGATVAGLDFVMRRGCVLHGRVLDKMTGRPLPQVKLRATYSGEHLESDDGFFGVTHSDVRSATTDEAGRYRIGGLRFKPYRIVIFGPDGRLLSNMSLEIPDVFALERDLLCEMSETTP